MLRNLPCLDPYQCSPRVWTHRSRDPEVRSRACCVRGDCPRPVGPVLTTNCAVHAVHAPKLNSLSSTVRYYKKCMLIYVWFQEIQKLWLDCINLLFRLFLNCLLSWTVNASTTINQTMLKLGGSSQCINYDLKPFQLCKLLLYYLFTF